VLSLTGVEAETELDYCGDPHATLLGRLLLPEIVSNVTLGHANAA
jgi:hypothetical protein